MPRPRPLGPIRPLIIFARIFSIEYWDEVKNSYLLAVDRGGRAFRGGQGWGDKGGVRIILIIEYFNSQLRCHDLMIGRDSLELWFS